MQPSAQRKPEGIHDHFRHVARRVVESQRVGLAGTDTQRGFLDAGRAFGPKDGIIGEFGAFRHGEKVFLPQMGAGDRLAASGGIFPFRLRGQAYKPDIAGIALEMGQDGGMVFEQPIRVAAREVHGFVPGNTGLGQRVGRRQGSPRRRAGIVHDRPPLEARHLVFSHKIIKILAFR